MKYWVVCLLLLITAEFVFAQTTDSTLYIHLTQSGEEAPLSTAWIDLYESPYKSAHTRLGYANNEGWIVVSKRQLDKLLSNTPDWEGFLES